MMVLLATAVAVAAAASAADSARELHRGGGPVASSCCFIVRTAQPVDTTRWRPRYCNTNYGYHYPNQQQVIRYATNLGRSTSINCPLEGQVSKDDGCFAAANMVVRRHRRTILSAQRPRRLLLLMMMMTKSPLDISSVEPPPQDELEAQPARTARAISRRPATTAAKTNYVPTTIIQQQPSAIRNLSPTKSPPTSKDDNANDYDDSFGRLTVDYVLTWLTSPAGSITFGILGLLLLLVSRLVLDVDVYTTTVEGLGQETRSNLLAAVAIGAVLVQGMSKLDIETITRDDPVALIGHQLPAPVIMMYWPKTVVAQSGTGMEKFEEEDKQDLSIDATTGTLAWALSSLITATPAKTAVCVQHRRLDDDDDPQSSGGWEIVGLAGVVPAAFEENRGGAAAAAAAEAKLQPTRIMALRTPILDRFRRTNQGGGGGNGKETYLPSLQNLPGKVEFTYLPPNCQAVLIIPIALATSSNQPADHPDHQSPAVMAIVLGSDQARSFTPKDIAWCQTVATRLGQVMGSRKDTSTTTS